MKDTTTLLVGKFVIFIAVIAMIYGMGQIQESFYKDKYYDTLARSHAVMWERLDKIEADFYGYCAQCHDGVTGATREEQEEMLHKILRGG